MYRLAVSGGCTGHGRCYSAAPDLLEDDDEGLVTLRNDSKLIPDETLPQARAAREECPEHAISLTEE